MTPVMSALSLAKRSSNKAAALIIVLAFVVILTGLAVAYLSRSTTDRQLAHTSFNDTDADVLAQSALDTVIGDFKQEIKNGSTVTSVSGTNIYVPTSNANMVPMRNGNPAIPNLIRRSLRSEMALWPNLAVGPAVGSEFRTRRSKQPTARRSHQSPMEQTLSHSQSQ
jgi:Tfp pilus assembly protein PilX